MTDVGEPLAARVRSGTVWGSANVLLSRAFQFLTTLVLARLLAPEHFGALAVALTVQMVVLNASELGATASLARADRDPAEIAPTVYTIALVTSGVLTLAMVAGAPSLAAAMGDPAATPVIRVMALTVILAGMCSVPTAMLWRNFEQKRRMVADLANVAATTALVIPMALDGWGAMSLAWSRVGGQVVATAIFILLATPRYRPGFRADEAITLVRQGVPLALANIVVFVTLNADYAVIGRSLGAVQLGFYLIAFNLASLPSNVFTQVVRAVAVPAFGRLHAARRLSEAAPEAIRLVALLAFPVGAWLTALSDPAIRGLYGERWASAAPALAWLGVFASGRAVVDLLADLCLAVARTQALMWIQILWLLTLVPALLVGVRWWGITGAGVAHAAVIWAIVLPVYIAVIRADAPAPVWRYLSALAPAAFASTASAILAHLVSSRIQQPVVALVVGGLVALASYLLIAFRPVTTALRAAGVELPRRAFRRGGSPRDGIARPGSA